MEINNYPNYLIYEDGRVYSKIGKGKFLKQVIDKDGYKIATLYNKNGKKLKKFHRLVAEHYIPNPENLPVVDHINHVRDDNRVENLRWATVSENSLNTDKVSSNSGFTYICDEGNRYKLQITKLDYKKSYSKKKYTIEEVVLIRDMILN
jgi:hypothetical protein